MAAGQGFKDFTTGEVLTAADVDGYLMQGVWVFASAAARDAAVTSPQEGNFAYLKDTNVTTYYTGSAWANLDTTGMTNPMTTTGDTIYSSSGSTPARLGIGTAGQVLTVNAGATAPEWKTAATSTSALTKITSASFTTQSSVAVDSCFTSTYTKYKVIYQCYSSVLNADLQFQWRYAGPTTQTSDYYGAGQCYTRQNNLFAFNSDNVAQLTLNDRMQNSAAETTFGEIELALVGNASENPVLFGMGFNSYYTGYSWYGGTNNVARTYTGFLLKPDSGTITGSYAVYGYQN